jgi:hypothetical protein
MRRETRTLSASSLGWFHWTSCTLRLAFSRKSTLTGKKAPAPGGNSHPLKPDGTQGLLPSNVSDFGLEPSLFGLPNSLGLNP